MGRFIYGTLDRCHLAVVQRHGKIHEQPLWETEHLVIGTLDITRPVLEQIDRLKKLGARSKVVTEEHWTSFL